VSELTPVMQAAINFAYAGGAAFTLIGIVLSYRRGRPHPLLLLCISAVSFSWIEAPYDWAVYAQFPPAIPRMPSWWLHDALAMGVQMMVFTYLLGRTDAMGRTLVEAWADSRAKSRLQASLLSTGSFIAIDHAVYLSVFTPHLVTRVLHLQTVGPTEQLFEGVPNQPL
jgi:hypothetical protein